MLNPGPKLSYFFLPVKVHFFHILGENRLNEWKSCIFFFQRQKKIQLRDRLNEWHVNFYRKKKTHKKHPKIWKKKTHPTFIKNKEKPTRSWINGSWTFSGKKKIHPCIFFPASREKKIQNFAIWLIDWPTNFFGIKKNTIPLHHSIVILNRRRLKYIFFQYFLVSQ